MTDMTDRDELIESIRSVQDDLTRLVAQDRSEPLLASTLTMQQLKVVIILSQEGSVSGQELSQRLRIGLGTVTGIVDRLVSQGLVHRFEDPTDRRVRRVALTAKGEQLISEFTDVGAARFRALLNRLDIDTLRDFDVIMRKIRAAIRESDDFSVAEYRPSESD